MSQFSKYASIIYRSSQAFFDDYLAPYHIGCGQQFFLVNIYEHPGISQYKLAKIGHFDKGTCARAVKKLEEEGYIEKKIQEADRRCVRLYPSEKGKQLIPVIRKMLREWNQVLKGDVSEEEEHIADALMRRISEHAMAHMQQK